MNTKPVITKSAPVTRSGCGCWGIGCAGVFVFMVLLVCGGLYSVMYTSLPLRMIERALEEDGKVRIEGLTGNVSKGIEIEKLEFVDDKGYWSRLEGVKFKYNGLLKAIASQRFVIDELSVEEGIIYAAFSKNQDLEIELEAPRIDRGDEPEVHGEFQVGKIDIGKLRLVNPETDVAFQFFQGPLRRAPPPR